MKKFLLMASMLVMGVVATFAQSVPSAKDWTIGQEVTGVIQNPSFSDATNKAWDVKFESGGPTVTGGAFEVWRGGNGDFYQYIQLPAGMYRLECQGYYRAGDAGLDSETRDDVVFSSGNWEDYVFISVRGGIYNASSKSFVENRKWETPLMPRLFEKWPNQIYTKTADQDDWYSDTYYEDLNCWGPGSHPATVKWFEEGRYKAYSNGDVKYNTVDFFVASDGDYVRIGVSKYGSAEGGETFFASNFKLYYEGEPDAEAKLAGKKDKVQLFYNQLDELRSKSSGLLRGLLDDALIQFENEFDINDLETEGDCDDANNALNKIYNDAMTMEGNRTSLEEAVKAIGILLTNTDYEGKAALQAIVDKANTKLDQNYDYNGAADDNWETYKNLTDALYAGRLEYMKSAPKVEGAQDFSAFINYPWFCKNEYSPTWNEEAGCYQYSAEIENTIVVATNEKNLKELVETHNNTSEEDKAAYEEEHGEGSWTDWVNISDGVTWTTNGSATGEWIFNHHVTSGWMGSPTSPTMQHGYTAVGEWSADPVGGYQEFRQVVTGLPAGYYSMAALFINAGQSPVTENQFVYIVPGTEPEESNMAKAQFTNVGKHWNDGDAGRFQRWRTDDWQDLRTDLIYTEDGTVTIGSRSNWFYAVTGFRLYYYGAEINYVEMLQPSYNQAKEDAKELWKGDIKAVDAILDKIDLAAIKDAQGYEEARKAITEANEYISAAKSAIDAWTDAEKGGIANFQALSSKYDDPESAENAIVMKALEGTCLVGEGDNSVYTDALDNNEQYKAYVSYMDFRDGLGEYLKDAAVAAGIAEQNTYLKATFATPEKLDEFKITLVLPINQAKFAELGADKATVDNPIDVTYLLTNPSFREGPTKGWTVEGTNPAINDEFGIELDKEGHPVFNEEGKPIRTIAELWGRSEETFTFSQIVAALPAGTYEIRSHAMYRDGWGADANGLNNYIAAGGDENWSKHNAVLFAQSVADKANKKTSYVKSIYSLREEKPTFTYYSQDNWFEVDEEKKLGYPTKITYLEDYVDDFAAYFDYLDALNYTNALTAENMVSATMATVPFDYEVTISQYDEEEYEEVEKTYYFPQRTSGVHAACVKDYNNYLNSVIIYLPEAGSIELGITRTTPSGGESLTMDDFELWYCGKEAPTAIEEVADAVVEGEGAVEYYSINGVQLSAPQPGINIVKYANGQVKKVFINK